MSTFNFKKYNKEYYLIHKTMIKKASKRWRLEHQEYLRKYYKEYYKLHRKEINEYTRNYRKNNKQKVILWTKKSIENNPDYLLIKKLRRRILHALKDNIKSIHTMELIGCSIEQLKQHLENQFTKGMTWNNHGKWHIDHIRPCDSFDLSKVSEQRKCFHYTNLQPLWAEDNRSKGNKGIK